MTRLILTAFAFVILLPQAALACSCISHQQMWTAQQYAAAGDLVVDAVAVRQVLLDPFTDTGAEGLSNAADRNSYRYETEYVVTAGHKGAETGQTITYRGAMRGGGACGMPPDQVGEETLLIARLQDDGTYAAGTCLRTYYSALFLTRLIEGHGTSHSEMSDAMVEFADDLREAARNLDAAE